MSDDDYPDLHHAVAAWRRGRAPRDRVGRPGADRAALLALDAASGQPVTVAGRITETGVDAPAVLPSAGIVVSRAVLAAAGLTDAEVPNLIVVDK